MIKETIARFYVIKAARQFGEDGFSFEAIEELLPLFNNEVSSAPIDHVDASPLLRMLIETRGLGSVIHRAQALWRVENGKYENVTNVALETNMGRLH